MTLKPQRLGFRFLLLFLTTLILNCQRLIPLPPITPLPPLRHLSPDEYPFFYDNGDREELVQAIRNQIDYFSRRTLPVYYPLGDTTLSSITLQATLERFLDLLEENEGQDLNDLIRENFDVFQSTGEKGTGNVIFTGYYLPLVEGSLTPDREYQYPLYRPPDDLVIKTVSPSGTKTAVRIKNGNEHPYFTRKQIDQEGVLKGKGYEIVYLKDLLDCYLLHVQGSGMVRLPDKSVLHLHFAGSNYLPYRSLREEMLKDEVLDPHNASMNTIRSYFASHPEQLQSYLNRNERYTFFTIWKGEMIGSLGVPLTPGRSIATDRQVFPAGALSYIVTSVPNTNTSGEGEKTVSWSRFVLNQDEGAAIKGPHRVDIFWGTGSQAESLASRLKHPGQLYFLIAKNIPR